MKNDRIGRVELPEATMTLRWMLTGSHAGSYRLRLFAKSEEAWKAGVSGRDTMFHTTSSKRAMEGLAAFKEGGVAGFFDYWYPDRRYWPLVWRCKAEGYDFIIAQDSAIIYADGTEELADGSRRKLRRFS